MKIAYQTKRGLFCSFDDDEYGVRRQVRRINDPKALIGGD